MTIFMIVIKLTVGCQKTSMNLPIINIFVHSSESAKKGHMRIGKCTLQFLIENMRKVFLGKVKCF